MAKVHPNVVVPAGAVVQEEQPQQQQPTVLTVWRKSLLFNCDGFTVYDATGGLAFRVDRYGSSSGSRRRRAEDVVLMDAAGKPLLTVRRKIKLSLNLAEHWVLYEGDAGAVGAKPLLSVRRHHVGLHRRASDKTLAHVTPFGSSSSSSGVESAAYVVDGSYGRRSCAVRDARGASAAEVRRKESVGDDVFRLVVSDSDQRMGAALAMGIVIALDQMFGGASSRTSLLPRSWTA